MNDEISKLARVVMQKSFLLPHPKHVVNEWDIGLWTLAHEYTQLGGKVLVRMYKCPLWDRFKFSVSLRIQEGTFGMIMEILGSHNTDSHLERGEIGPILRFIKGKQLFREEEIPEVIAIQEELERANPQWKTEHSKLTINGGDFSSVCSSKDVDRRFPLRMMMLKVTTRRQKGHMSLERWSRERWILLARAPDNGVDCGRF